MRDAIREILIKGGTVEFGRVSICDISRYVNFNVGRKKWQVHSDDYRRPFSQLYGNLDEAIGTFVNTIRITNG